VLTFEQIKELIELVARHRLSGVEVERSGFRLKIDGVETVAAVAAAPAPERSAGAPGAAGAAAAQALPAGVALAGLPVHAGDLGAAAPPGTMAAAGGFQGLAAGSPGAAEGARSSRSAHILNSPIVGTFYQAPAPEAPPFTSVGARVARGQVLCIIEAMKLMNEIESDVDGTVVEIYPQNAQAVEFGEPLFAIEPA
jgi:acetyl-CoA carboxylase biotin carboxyl carrier protein